MKRKIVNSKRYMNTDITIHVIDEGQGTVLLQESIENAFGEFERIVKNYTRFENTSELSKLNLNSGNWFKVSEEFFYLIEKLLDLAKNTDGAFDPTVIDFLDIYGYNSKKDFSNLKNPNLNEIIKKTVKNRSSYNSIQLNKDKLSVQLMKNQKIDLGGIGKGYAIDCAYNKLSLVNSNFLIDAGGDIRTKGLNELGNIWEVGLKSQNGIFGKIKLDNMALASSGSWARKVKNFHHLISPKDGKPSEQSFDTIFVIAPDATMADGWATALFINPELKTPENLHFITK